MKSQYILISETNLPMRDGDEHRTVVRMYDLEESRYDFLCNVRSYLRNDGTYGPHNPAPAEVVEAGSVEDVIRDDLNLTDDTYAAPGALYHMYDVTMFGRVVLVADTLAYNV